MIQVANLFVVYKPNSKSELVSISDRIGMDADDLKAMFKQFCPEYYDFIMIDKTKGSLYPLRKNIYEIISYNSDSD